MAGITQKRLKSYISIVVPFEKEKGKLQCGSAVKKMKKL